MAFAAAAFYAVNIPFSKILLDSVEPAMMAAFLYLGAGAGMSLFYAGQEKKDDRLEKSDLPYVVGMIVLDIAAPILLMFGLASASASSASLLGNFEIVATSLIAMMFFGEAMSPKLWAGIGLVTLASAILSFESSSGTLISEGSVLVLAATCCWGLENNCTRKISSKNTYQIVALKGVFAGAGALGIALVSGETVPALVFVLATSVLGFLTYGLSIFFYVRAQNGLGAARTSAYYAVTPFVGALLSLAILGEPISQKYLLALAVMVLGTSAVIADTMRGENAVSVRANKKNRFAIFHWFEKNVFRNESASRTHTKPENGQNPPF